MQHTFLHSQKAFSIIEVLIGIFIFSLGLVSIYALLVSSLQVNDYNKNAIIASNLAREQLELYRNIRDTNYKKLKVWNQINPNDLYNENKLFTPGEYYKIENDFTLAATSSIQVEKIENFAEWQDVLSTQMQSYRLCLNPQYLYTYDCSGWKQKTSFYRYLYIEKSKNEAWDVIEGAYNIT